MYKKVLVLMLVLGLALGLFTPVQAQTSKFESSIAIRNLTGDAGSINITFIDLNGNVVGSPVDAPINPNETLSFYQSTMPVANGFNGSVVVSSDVEIAAMSNLVRINSKGQSESRAAYSGFSIGSMNVYLPALFKSYYGINTFFYIQNTGNEATKVEITYSDGTSKTIDSIEPRQSVVIDQASETHTMALFSGMLTSDDAPIAVTVVEESQSLFSYTGFGAGSENPLMPLINENNYGVFTGAQIMNTGDQDTEVTVIYTPSMAGTACFETRTIEAESAVTFAQDVFYNRPSGDVETDCVHGETFIGSAMVATNTSKQPLVVVVNQLNSKDVKGGAYIGFDPAQGGRTIVYPLIMDRNYGYFTSHSIVNVGSEELAVGTLSCVFTGTGIAGPFEKTITNPVAIPANGSWTMNHDKELTNRFVGGATCTGPVGSLLVGTSNQLGTTAVGFDSLLVSEGFIVK